jgi:hypothetical protein
MKTNLGTKVYYTGDMANSSGNFEVVDFAGSYVTLREIDGEGRRFQGIHTHQIGDVYQGHCNPRFVTEEARQAFRKARGL